MIGVGRSRTQTLLLAGIGLTVLLGVVAFVSRGHQAPGTGGGTNRGASQVLVNSIFTLWFLAMCFGVVLLMWTLAQKRRAQAQRFRVRPLAMALILVFIPVLALSIGGRVGLFGHNNKLPHATSKNTAAEEAKRRRALMEKNAHPPSFEWSFAAGVIALVIGIAVTAILRRHARRTELAGEVTLFEEISRVLDETLDDLRRESDPRKAVIAAYARMEQILAVHGLPRHPSEAPQEYLERVLVELHVAEPFIARLTDLFTRAKFSQHEIDPTMKDDAIEALVDLRDHIRAIDQLVDKPPLDSSDVPKEAQ